ncbi:MAG TPA: hypothetical protein VHR17_00045 [Thermoanaerobaculia bacterium]|jgi:hypothetical protein|nr:hypothetical protein [Thermoanaerobaculia bacterium]
MASDFELNLERFWFPGALADNRANFRFVVDIRLIRAGRFATDTAVLPGFDTWWECDQKKAQHPNYVRADGNMFDMEKIDAWQRLVLLTRADTLHSVQVKVFDVDRPDAWDALRDAFGQIAQTVIGRAPRLLDLPDLAADSFGAVEEDLRSTIVKRLAGGDRLLFRGSSPLQDPGIVKITGPGTAGDYTVHLRLEQR